MIFSDVIFKQLPEPLAQQVSKIAGLLNIETAFNDPLNFACKAADNRPKILIHYLEDPHKHAYLISADILTTGKHLVFCPNLDIECETLLISNGFHGVLTLDACEIEIIEALKSVNNNRLYFSHDAMSRYIQSRKRQPNTQRQIELLSLTTKKEQRVLTLVCQGLTNDEIATNLGISVNTVKMHMQNIFKKTKISSRGQLSYAFAQV
ncbi:response regulator transcription factor [Shewanella sp. UCD-KL21]|uniref:transcriptional regulator n=1 Tax=Shewanella sp. UCD-KL21 TaxID=1917164 RepID=UPI00097143A5|nr:response regulator transcription factor [Shewanella sp. UCD-KL21]